MREYRFRAWDKVKKEMFSVSALTCSRVYEEFCNNVPGKHVPRNEVVLMQSIGMKDVNGTSIYEGDVVRLEDESGQSRSVYVYYSAAYLRYNLLDNRTVREASFVGDLVIEVIGNIHEDPELFYRGTDWKDVGSEGLTKGRLDIPKVSVRVL